MTGEERRRLVRLVARLTMGALAVAAAVALPPWLSAGWSAAPMGLRHGIALGFLYGLIVVAALGWLAAPVAVAVGTARLVAGRRSGQSRPWAARSVALGTSALAGLVLLEAAAAWLHARSRSVAMPIVAPPPKPSDPLAGPLPGRKAPPRMLRLLVLGESSARGEPFHPWLSVGQILAWQLEKVLPGRAVEVVMKAYGGAPLDPMLPILRDLDDRPDVILVYSGHNEFQSRWAWKRDVDYYGDDRATKPPPGPLDRLTTLTPLGRLVGETIDRQVLDIPPPKRVTRVLVDRPTCTHAEYADVLDLFGRQLEAIVAYAERLGSVPILVVPAGNDAGFEPSRSFLASWTKKAEREDFAGRFLRLRDQEADDPEGSLLGYNRLLVRHPEFAEAHFRAARLLERAGRYVEADEHYTRARDLDGLPMRCPSVFQAAYRRVAARHPSVVLIDGPAVIRRLGLHRLLDDHLFLDAQHPTFRSYLALAQEALDQLGSRRALGWPAGVAPPRIDPDACASRFGLTSERWARVCEQSNAFYGRVAYIRYDPAERISKAEAFARAAAAIRAGKEPEAVGIPGLGVHPPGLRDEPAPAGGRAPVPVAVSDAPLR